MRSTCGPSFVRHGLRRRDPSQVLLNLTLLSPSNRLQIIRWTSWKHNFLWYGYLLRLHARRRLLRSHPLSSRSRIQQRQLWSRIWPWRRRWWRWWRRRWWSWRSRKRTGRRLPERRETQQSPFLVIILRRPTTPLLTLRINATTAIRFNDANNWTRYHRNFLGGRNGRRPVLFLVEQKQECRSPTGAMETAADF